MQPVDIGHPEHGEDGEEDHWKTNDQAQAGDAFVRDLVRRRVHPVSGWEHRIPQKVSGWNEVRGLASNHSICHLSP
jgi:endo-1,4-beta-D-glucanase Y